MSKLTTKERNKLPDKDFALPGRRYPIVDETHCQNALARSEEMYKKGKLSKKEYETIQKKAKEKLKELSDP